MPSFQYIFVSKRFKSKLRATPIQARVLAARLSRARLGADLDEGAIPALLFAIEAGMTKVTCARSLGNLLENDSSFQQFPPSGGTPQSNMLRCAEQCD